jgi:hypothetical protein
MAKKTTSQKLFAAVSPDFGPRFAFNAKDEQQANGLINSWNRYHSFNCSETHHTVKEIQADDLAGLSISVHNEYIN